VTVFGDGLFGLPCLPLSFLYAAYVLHHHCRLRSSGTDFCVDCVRTWKVLLTTVVMQHMIFGYQNMRKMQRTPISSLCLSVSPFWSRTTWTVVVSARRRKPADHFSVTVSWPFRA